MENSNITFVIRKNEKYRPLITEGLYKNNYILGHILYSDGRPDKTLISPYNYWSVSWISEILKINL